MAISVVSGPGAQPRSGFVGRRTSPRRVLPRLGRGHHVGRPAGSAPALATAVAPGLALTVAAVALATAANRLYPSLSPLTAAVALGVVAANLLPRAMLAAARPGLTVAAKRVMRWGIVLLGLQLAVGDVLGLGWEALVLVVVVVGATSSGDPVARPPDGPPRPPAVADRHRLRHLRRVGGRGDGGRDPPPRHARGRPRPAGRHRTGHPVRVAGDRGPSAAQGAARARGPGFGHWVGASVHDIGQVVAAAGTGGAAAVQPAVVVKLMRVAMLAPMVAGAALVERRRAGRCCGHRRRVPRRDRGRSGESGAATRTRHRRRDRRSSSSGSGSGSNAPKTKKPPILPLFVVGFLAMIALRSTGVLPAAALGHAKQLQDLLLAAGMFGLGSGVRIGELRRTGSRPLLLGLASWLLIAAVAYIGVRLTG